MCKTLIYLASLVLVLGLVASTVVADMVAYYPLDKGRGNTATDASGNGHDGTLNGDPRGIVGKFGQALEFPGTAGSCVNLGTWNPSEGTDQLTIALWVKWNGLSGQWQGLISKRNSWDPAPIGEMMWFLEANQATGVLWFGRRDGGGVGSSGQTLPEGEWQHLAITCDGTTATMYRDGEQLNSGSFTLGSMTNAGFQIGSGYINGGGPFNGAVDDVRIYNNVLTAEEIQDIMLGQMPQAYDPKPRDGYMILDIWVKISWSPGDNASQHDVYFGDNFDDVDAGTGGTFQGNQTATSFTVGLPGGPYPDGLVPGTTYYWRIDEFDGSATYKGEIWSFRTLSEIQTVEERMASRYFPSVFQAWNPADNISGEDSTVTLARHDLIWHGAGFYRLAWNADTHQGLSESFRSSSISEALAFRRRLLSLNPNMILLMEIRYRDAWDRFLPASSAWWMRDDNGDRVHGWAEGSFFMLNYADPAFQTHVAARCKATIDTGVIDGILLDWWNDDEDRISLIRTIRQMIGYEPVIIVNSNHRKVPNTAAYVNGLFMEVYSTSTAQDWENAADTLLWAEEHLLTPRLNCLETWYHISREDLNLMRATTTLSLTHSNGYCLFSEPNPLPNPDHMHNWYSFWDKEIRPGEPKLGRPVAPRFVRPDRVITRKFEYGIVAYNPAGNTEVTLVFAEPVESVATNIVGLEHILDDEDGDIYVTISYDPSHSFSSSEGFETGDFSKFDWSLYDDVNWTVTSEERNSGEYSTRTGSIDHDERATLRVTLDCVSGDITFYRKVSSELDYDHLEFYIDGEEMDKWSGEEEWAEVSFHVDGGKRTFEWIYSKDGSESGGDDTAWIDDIVFPIE